MRVHSLEEEPATGNTLTCRRRATEGGDGNKHREIYVRSKFTSGLQELGSRALADTAGRKCLLRGADKRNDPGRLTVEDNEGIT